MDMDGSDDDNGVIFLGRKKTSKKPSQKHVPQVAPSSSVATSAKPKEQVITISSSDENEPARLMATTKKPSMSTAGSSRVLSAIGNNPKHAHNHSINHLQAAKQAKLQEKQEKQDRAAAAAKAAIASADAAKRKSEQLLAELAAAAAKRNLPPIVPAASNAVASSSKVPATGAAANWRLGSDGPSPDEIRRQQQITQQIQVYNNIRLERERVDKRIRETNENIKSVTQNLTYIQTLIDAKTMEHAELQKKFNYEGGPEVEEVKKAHADLLMSRTSMNRAIQSYQKELASFSTQKARLAAANTQASEAIAALSDHADQGNSNDAMFGDQTFLNHAFKAAKGLFEDENPYSRMFQNMGNLDNHMVNMGIRGVAEPELPYGHNDSVDQTTYFADCLDEFAESATVLDAVKKLGLVDQTSLLPSMAITLMPHQLIGVSWMKDTELGKHKGGILADDMGLGKTVEAIALCAANPPGEKGHPTLIIAPLALITQWKLEIENKTERHKFRICVHHGPTKCKTAKELKSYDFVITTTGGITGEAPEDDFDIAQRKRKKAKEARKKMLARSTAPDGTYQAPAPDDSVTESSDDEFKVRKTKRPHPLFEIEWHRIIIDEAQNIRNKNTKASRAVCHLEAEHRWALTGTPVTNTLQDLYAFLRFCRIRPYYDWDRFRTHIVAVEKLKPGLAAKRAQVILRPIFMRRKKDTKLDGKPIFVLPDKHIRLVELEFGASEREIYDMVEKASRAKFNEYFKRGTVLKNYANILVMIMRLRQLCSHPKLLVAKAGEDGNQFLGDIENLDAAAIDEDSAMTETKRAENLLGADFVERVRRFRSQRLDELAAAEKKGGEIDESDFNCPICFEQMTDSLITPCLHEFCKECIQDYVTREPDGNGLEAEDERRQRAGVRSCPSCRQDIKKELLFNPVAFDVVKSEEPNYDDDVAEDDLDMTAVLKPNRSNRLKMDSDDEYDNKENKGFFAKRSNKKRKLSFDDDSDFEEAEPLIPSTKMKAMMDVVRKMCDERPNEKVIVYSQWVKMLDLVEQYLSDNNIRACRYDGSMSKDSRDETINKFCNQEHVRVALISLKCGGVGLNLTRASNAVMLDLAWNDATESQARDRIHRIGQMREVNVHRMVIKDTIEQRILDIQARKLQLADGALGEGTGKKMSKLTVNDLKQLFNASRH